MKVRDRCGLKWAPSPAFPHGELYANSGTMRFVIDRFFNDVSVLRVYRPYISKESRTYTPRDYNWLKFKTLQQAADVACRIVNRAKHARPRRVQKTLFGRSR